MDVHCVSVWQWSGERTKSANVVERHTGIAPAVMVWGAMGYDFGSPPVVICSTLMAQRYVSDILRLHVFPFLRQHPGTDVQQNNACSHMAYVSTDCLCHDEVLLWPARSPNFSPIKHVWDQLGRHLQTNADLPDLQGWLWVEVWLATGTDITAVWLCFVLNRHLYPGLKGCHTLLTWEERCVHTAN